MTMVVKESEVEGALKSFTISAEIILRSFCQREPSSNNRKESSSLAFWHHILLTFLSVAENFTCIISILLHKAYEVDIIFLELQLFISMLCCLTPLWTILFFSKEATQTKEEMQGSYKSSFDGGISTVLVSTSVGIHTRKL